MNELSNIVLGDYIEVLTDYHANGSYEVLKKNVALKRLPDYAIMIRTLNFERPDFKLDLIYLNEAEYYYLSKTKVYPNDILMNKIANPGSVYLMPDLEKPVSLAMNLFLIRFSDKVNQQFMFYLMKLSESYIKRFANGTTTLTITKDAVRGLSFEIPQKHYQDKIAKTLSNIDKKIELNNKINTELEAMAKLIYDYWFVQFDFPDANGKPYKSSGGKMVYNEVLKREIPEGWGDGTLSDLGEIVGGSTPSTKKSENFTVNGMPWITPKDLSKNIGNKFVAGGGQDVSTEGIKSASLKIYPKNTVLMSSRAPIGYMAIASRELTTNQGFKSFVHNKGYSSYIIFYSVKNSMKAIIQYSSGSTFKEVSDSVLKTVKVCLPKLEITESYSNKVK